MTDILEERNKSLQAAEEITAPYYDPKEVLYKPGTPYTPKSSPDLTAQQKQDIAVADMVRRAKQEENSKLNPFGGWKPLQQRWYPHKSHEGGASTIAYGIKLSNGGELAKLAIKQGYLTDEQVEEGMPGEALSHYLLAKDPFDKKYGEGSFDQLNPKLQSILGDYQYGVRGGLASFPKLMQAAYDGDIEGLRREYRRYDGNKNPLGRNKGIAKDIDSLVSHYPISPVKKVEK